MLDEDTDGQMINERGILYAPDYVINAGGLINVYQELQGYDREEAKRKVGHIYDTLLNIFDESKKSGITTNMASGRIAENRIAAARGMTDLRQKMKNQRWVSKDLRI